MRNTTIISIALTILALTIAILMSLSGPRVEEPEPPPEPPPPLAELIPPGARADKDVTVKVLSGGEITEMPMELFLLGVLSAEMPASFELEALKAQAVAARTDVLYNMYVSRKPAHPEADVCSEYSCCMAYNSDEQLRVKWGDDYVEYITKIIRAVIETDSVYMAYEGAPILAVFHSSSAGKTETSGNVWLSDMPYLLSVDSPETEEQVPDYVSGVTVLRTDFVETVRNAYPDAVFGEDESLWITEIEYTESGRIASLKLGGVTVTGPLLRSMFDLRSTAVSIEFTDKGIVFTTTGYGHGVGMSQYGANVMAAQGSDFIEILSAYYSGIEFIGAEGSASI